MCLYVSSEIEHHLRSGWQTAMDADDLALTKWLGEIPQDDIVIGVGKVLGLDRLSLLAAKAEGVGDFWRAGRYWSVASILAHKTLNHASLKAPVIKALDCIATHVQIARSAHESAEALDEVYDLQLGRFAAYCTLIDGPGLILRKLQIEEVVASPAAGREPLAASMVIFFAQVLPALIAGDMGRSGDITFNTAELLHAASGSDPDPEVRYLCSQHLCNMSTVMLDNMLLSKVLHAGLDFDWDRWYGPHAERQMATLRAYDFDKVHSSVRESTNVDHLMVMASNFVPISLHYGNTQAAREHADLALPVMMRVIELHDQQPESLGIVWGLPAWCLLSTVTGMVTAAQQNAILGLMTTYGITWLKAGDTVDGPVVNRAIIRERGDKTTDIHCFTSESVAWLGRCGHLLTARSIPEGVTKAEVMSSLPSVEEVISWTAIWQMGSMMHATHGPCCNCFVYLALLCEKFECWQEVVMYTGAALDPDLKNAGCHTPITRTMSLSLRARAHAALGQQSEAARDFETAAQEAHRVGLWLLEAFALRDLKLLVLDKMGHGEHGSRRLGAVLRLLTGPAEMLTPLLNGLDAAELMQMEPPEAGDLVVYAEEDAAVAALREQLQAMGLLTLQRRAVADGVDEKQMKVAMDSDEPKSQLIALIVERYERSTGADDVQIMALREELQGLRLLALQKRATAAGITEDEILEACSTQTIRRQLSLTCCCYRCHRCSCSTPQLSQIDNKKSCRMVAQCFEY
eukprot:SAG22_NODE_1496_length_4293_cov_1.736052_1_plen_744_part_00